MQQRSAKNRKSPGRRRKSPISIKNLLVVFLLACFAAAVIIFPSPEKQHKGSIELHGIEPEVEVYGPELPQNIVEGFSNTPVDSVVVSAEDEEEDTLYVYAAKDAECYHLGTCKFAFASAQKLTVYEATMLGYRPCGRCNPPVYSSDMIP